MSENIKEQLNIADAKGGKNNEGGESSRPSFEISADNPELSKTTDQLNDLHAMVAGDKQINAETLQKIREQILALQNKEKEKIHLISASYTHPDGKQEIINLTLETRLADFLSFYQTTNIYLPPNFEDTIRDIWEKNQTKIEQAIEQNGFDDMLIIPPVADTGDLSEKMKMENGYYTGSSFDAGGGFAGAKSENADKPRIIIFHKKTLPKIQEENGLDVHLNITAGDARKLFAQNPDEQMNLIDFLIMERKVFEESNIHISDYKEKSGQWLNTGAGARLVDSCWHPGHHKLRVAANDPEYQCGYLGVRPARCFF